MKIFISWKWPQANPNPKAKLSPRVRVWVNSWENANTCEQKKFYLLEVHDPKLTLTLTLSLALGFGLGLTLGKTISDKNLKPNAKDEYRRTRLGKNL